MAKAIADADKVTMKLENERKKRKDPLRLPDVERRSLLPTLRQA
jgi:hypothetical protein